MVRRQRSRLSPLCLLLLIIVSDGARAVPCGASDAMVSPWGWLPRVGTRVELVVHHGSRGPRHTIALWVTARFADRQRSCPTVRR